MIGAIAGDMIGKPYERCSIKHKDFDPLVHGFTDDTVLTVAVAHAILTGEDMAETIRAFANRHPHAGYGRGFGRWMRAWENKPYHSFGNGAAMRVSPVGFAYDTEADVLNHADRWAAVTRSHSDPSIYSNEILQGILQDWLSRKTRDREGPIFKSVSLLNDLENCLKTVKKFCKKCISH